MKPGEFLLFKFKILAKKKGENPVLTDYHDLRIFPNEHETINHVLERVKMTMDVILNGYRVGRPDEEMSYEPFDSNPRGVPAEMAAVLLNNDFDVTTLTPGA